MKFFLLSLMLLLCGCQKEVYTLNDYLNDTQTLFLIEEDIQTTKNKDSILRCQDMATILLDIAHEKEIEYLIYLGCFDESEWQDNIVISKQRASQINQLIYTELYQREYYETMLDIGEIESVDENIDLSTLSPGLYEQNGNFYEISEEGVYSFDIEDLDLESTFHPNLESSVILPEGSETNIAPTVSHSSFGIQKLASRYFQFKLKDYTIDGRVQSNGVQVKVQKKTKDNITIENELSIEDLACTIDLSLEEKQFYFRVDYNLKDTLSISKEKQIYQDKIELDSFTKIKEKLAQVIGQNALVEDELHLLTFQFEVPSTGKLVKVVMDLSLKLMANGEAKITFSSKQSQGSQSFQDSLCHLNSQKWEIQPYLEGNVECASVLSFELKLGNLHIADVALQGGIGSEAIGKVHYVDLEKELIETESVDIDLLTMQNILDSYNQLGNRYVDCCIDANIYYFARIKANQKSSLLKTLGLYGSMTPIKNELSLLHIENHHEVDTCTKSEILFNPKTSIEAFDISNYQLYLTIGKKITLHSSKEKCTYSSSNPSVVSVDENGVVTALKEGYATIIVEVDGVTRQCLVFVSNEETTKAVSFSCK